MNELKEFVIEDLAFNAMHRIDEMATISRPSDKIPQATKIKVYGENDEQGTKIPHFHVEIKNGLIVLEVKFEHIANMTIWRTKGNYPKSWDNLTDIRERIKEWMTESPKKNFGLTNLQRMILAWNDGNPTNEITEDFTN